MTEEKPGEDRSYIRNRKRLAILFLVLSLPCYVLWASWSFEWGYDDAKRMVSVIVGAIVLEPGTHRTVLGRQTPCDSELCRFARQNGIYSKDGKDGDFVAESTPQYGCPYWWWPWQSCISITTNEAVYSHPGLRRLIQEAILDPCRFAFHPPPGAALSPGAQRAVEEKQFLDWNFFQCDRFEGRNRFDVALTVVKDVRRGRDDRVVFFPSNVLLFERLRWILTP